MKILLNLEIFQATIEDNQILDIKPRSRPKCIPNGRMSI